MRFLPIPLLIFYWYSNLYVKPVVVRAYINRAVITAGGIFYTFDTIVVMLDIFFCGDVIIAVGFYNSIIMGFVIFVNEN